MRLSVIINTYNRPETLKLCLEHLTRQRADSSWEVIVVDDGGSTDLNPLQGDFGEKLSLRVHRIPHGGIAVARNAGAALASGDRLWFVGDDVLTSPGCWAVHAAERDENVAILGPYPQPERNISPPLRFWTDTNHFQFIRDPENAGYYFFLTGNISMSRAKFQSLGGFDEQYHPYGWEDIDFGLKFDLVGGRIRFIPDATAVHAHPPIGRRDVWRREYWVGYAGRRYYEKWKQLGPEKLEPTRFWTKNFEYDREIFRPGPAWRRALGAALVGLSDTLAPGSRLNAQLFERMVYTCRLKGFADGATAKNLTNISPRSNT